MIRRILPIVLLSGAVVALTAHTTIRTDPASLTVHEWGTFTSIAGEDGNAVDWSLQQGPSDLPCFVDRLPFRTKGWAPGTVRMETPVLYFYTDTEMAVTVRVRFRQGILTEWYPKAIVTPHEFTIATAFGRPDFQGAIAWKNVKVLPRADEAFPTDNRPSHYYPARETDASPLQVGSQKEKFLFYRGVARFAPPISATVASDGTIVVKHPEGEPLGDIILFENRAGRTGYRIQRAAGARATLARPLLRNGSVPPSRELEKILIAEGLYTKEAKAMVETWRDSWFEEGTRVFYVVSRKAVDSILPLEIDPMPTSVARVFVGRLEVVTPEMLQDVQAAIGKNDQVTLRRYGRFFDPLVQRLRAAGTDTDRHSLDQKLRAVYASWHVAPAPCD
jgi:hypothetical protein